MSTAKTRNVESRAAIGESNAANTPAAGPRPDVRALARELAGHVSWTTPKGGFFVWTTFPGLNTDLLLTRAVACGVLYVPGSAFFVEHRGDSHARLSFAAPSHERLVEGVKRLAAAVREELAATTKSEAGAIPDSEGELEARPKVRSSG